jgi:uncharacterized membrane protein YccF (DUF307 family)
MPGPAPMRAERRIAYRSLIAILLFTVAVGAATYAICLLAHWPFGLPQLAMLAFFAVLTGALHLWQESAMLTDPKGFMFRFMIGLVLKLLSALVAVVAILMLLPRGKAVPLSLTFAALYLAFLAFSTVRLSTRSRNLPRP